MDEYTFKEDDRYRKAIEYFRGRGIDIEAVAIETNKRYRERLGEEELDRHILRIGFRKTFEEYGEELLRSTENMGIIKSDANYLASVVIINVLSMIGEASNS